MLRYVVGMESLSVALILTSIPAAPPHHQIISPLFRWGLQAPPPKFVFCSLECRGGERCVDGTGRASRRGARRPACWSSVRPPLRLQVEGELPLLAQALAAHLHRQPPHAGAAAVQAEVAAHVAELRVGLNLLPFLGRDDDGWG